MSGMTSYAAPTGVTGPSIAILGAGAAGLCLAMRLKQRGFHRFTIYEKSDRIGGTWRDNTYPGAGCDVPSHLYSFSFEPKFDWSRVYAMQPEILRYLEYCVRKYKLLPHLRCGVEITRAQWDEAAARWCLIARTGEQFVASIVVSGTGQLNRPHMPDIPGIEEFAGTLFHSARWDHGHNLANREVAVVGNGASAIQLVPAVAKVARRVRIFQRSPNWILPRRDRSYTVWEQWAMRHVPVYARLVRLLIYGRHECCFLAMLQGNWFARLLQRQAKRYLNSQVTDRALRRMLTPDYPIGCKRILISDDYYQTLVRPNVEVITEPIERIVARGLLTRDGREHRADTLIFATGFEATSFLAPMQIQGRGGRSLADAWRDGAEAYLGITVAGFPNLFLLYGPNTNLGHNSILFMIECQVNYILQGLAQLQRQKLAWMEVRPEVQARFNSELQDALAKTAWQGSCTSWYKTAGGKVTGNWSSFATAYWWRTHRFVATAFTFAAPGGRANFSPASRDCEPATGADQVALGRMSGSI